MNKLRGFTLIELLIVVAIIGILAAIAVPNFLGAQVRAKVAKAQAEMRSIQNALESFYIDNNTYPPMCGGERKLRRQYKDQFDEPELGTIDIAHIATGTRDTDVRIYLTTPVAYITSLPYDPFHGDGQEYSYGYGSCDGSYYVLTSWGPDQQDGIGDPDKLNEWQYTGARMSDRFEVAVRDSQLIMADFLYEPSNGTTSQGDLIKTGP